MATLTWMLMKILLSCDWMVAMMPMVMLTLKNGLQVSNAIPSGMLTELFVFYTLRTYTSKTFMSLSKVETNENGLPNLMIMANVLWSKFASYNF